MRYCLNLSAGKLTLQTHDHAQRGDHSLSSRVPGSKGAVTHMSFVSTGVSCMPCKRYSYSGRSSGHDADICM